MWAREDFVSRPRHNLSLELNGADAAEREGVEEAEDVEEEEVDDDGDGDDQDHPTGDGGSENDEDGRRSQRASS